MNLNNCFNARLLLILISIYIVNIVSAQNVSYNTAQSLAKSYFSTKNKSLKSETSLVLANANKKDTLYYIFNNGSNGFVIVAGDYSVYPILGYSDEGNFNNGQQSPEISYWLDGYAKQINAIKAKKKNLNINSAWNSYLNDGFSKSTKSLNNGVMPLLKTTWSQAPYYNQDCPACKCSEWNGHCVTGCVATSMGQIMKYYNYPAQGEGSHSYVHPQYGTLSVDFSKETYNWANMPNSVSGSNYTAVANFLYDCGVSVDMNYTPIESGSNDYAAASALIQYFKYRNTITLEARSSYKDVSWEQLITNNLDLKQPILYGGDDPTAGGHAWVCDGYQTDAFDSIYFHMNWGWGGFDNGYFLISNLDAGNIEGNGEDFNFTSGQSAVVNIAPYGAPYCLSKMILTKPTDDISDGSGESFYWAKTHCDWLIEPPDAKNITLYFTDFSTVQGTDFVTVYDGDTTTATVLGSFSGNNIPPVLTSTSGKMLITFNSVAQDSGWNAVYYVPYCSSKTILTKSTDIISDGSGKSSYFPYTNCDWLIEPTNAKSVVLTFKDFNTVYDSDFVTVYDGDTTTAKKLGSFSGDTIPPVLTATNGKMLITFTSSGPGEGWDASYTSNTKKLTGINEEVNSNEIELYPNPVKDVLNLIMTSDIEGNAIVNIYNITGQKVFSKQITLNKSLNSFDLSSLNPGMYILEILNNEVSINYKIFKQ